MECANDAVTDVQRLLAVAEQTADDCLNVLKYSRGLVQHDIFLVRSQLEFMLKKLETKAYEHLEKLVTQTEHAVDNVIKDIKHIVECIGTRSNDEHSIHSCHTLLGQKMTLLQKKRLTFKANETLTAVLAQINSIGYIEIHELDANGKRNSVDHIESTDMDKKDHRNCIANLDQSVIDNKVNNVDDADSKHFAYRSQRKRIDDIQAHEIEQAHNIGTLRLQNKHGDHKVTKPKFSKLVDKTSHDWRSNTEENDILSVNELYSDVNPLTVLRSMQGHTLTHSNDTDYDESKDTHLNDLKFTRESNMDMKNRRQDSKVHVNGVINDDSEPCYLKKTRDVRRRTDTVYRCLSETDNRASSLSDHDATTFVVNHEYINDTQQNNTELKERKSFDYEVERGRYLRNKLKYRRARSIRPMRRWTDTNGDIDSEITRCSDKIINIAKTPSQNVQHTQRRQVLNNVRNIKLEDMPYHKEIKHTDDKHNKRDCKRDERKKQHGEIRNTLHQNINSFRGETVSHNFEIRKIVEYNDAENHAELEMLDMDVAERNDCGFGNAVKTNIGKKTTGIIKNCKTNEQKSTDTVLADNEGEHNVKHSEFKEVNSSNRKSLSISDKRRRNRSVPVDISLFLKTFGKEASQDVVEACLDKERNTNSSLLAGYEKLSAKDTRVPVGLCYTDKSTTRANVNNYSNSTSYITHVTMHKRNDDRKSLKSRLPSFSDMLYSGQ